MIQQICFRLALKEKLEITLQEQSQISLPFWYNWNIYKNIIILFASNSYPLNPLYSDGWGQSGHKNPYSLSEFLKLENIHVNDLAFTAIFKILNF